ncbi:MAG: hypothetical protein QOE65_1610 [Solirubrobacteraceae bacterium]|jgi:hypothetical protein|nr:hypothetical protein [Solirubrobacteraceae bacterium]
MTRTFARNLILAVLALAVLATAALAHPERTTVFPDPAPGKVPAYRAAGPTLVVCKPDSLARIRKAFAGDPRGMRPRLKMLRRCRFRHIQSAVNAAKSGYRILVMPGLYREEPSRAVPVGSYGQGPCANEYVETEGFTNTAPPPAGPASNDPPVRPNRNFQIKCPNSKNLIAVIGDPRLDPDPAKPLQVRCLQRCNLQISGYGKRPSDVVIEGDRRKADVLRADRANGLYLSNFTIEQGAFNDVDIVETDGFRVSQVVARYGQHYGVLTFTSIHGLYDHVEAYGNGDSGVYPGSGAKGCDYVNRNAYGTCERGSTAANPRAGCGTFTTELRQIDSHHNVLGYSGTAGNSSYVHDSHFHDNNAGLTTDSFAAGHPGMPQECFQWEHNVINSNNENYFTKQRQDYCNATPFEKRPKEIVCPQFQISVGTGVLIGGGNRNLLKDNYIYDNWKWGVTLGWVAGAVRGDNDPDHQNDTSNGNQFIGNHMGMRPDGTPDPNGADFVWDGQGSRNCWSGNTSKSGPSHQFQGPAPGPAPCPGSDVARPSDPIFYSQVAPCFAWDPRDNPRPVGCDWFDTPPEPQPS